MRTISGSTFDYADGDGSSAKYKYPYDIAASPDGKWASVLDDGDYAKVRRLDFTSAVLASTLAGGGSGSADGSAQQAKMSKPRGLAVSPDGTWIAVADTENHAIRKVDVSTGSTTTLVGMQTCTMTGSPPSCENTGSMVAGGFADGFAAQKFKDAVAAVCSTANSPLQDVVEAVASDDTTTRLTLVYMQCLCWR